MTNCTDFYQGAKKRTKDITLTLLLVQRTAQERLFLKQQMCTDDCILCILYHLLAL